MSKSKFEELLSELEMTPEQAVEVLASGGSMVSGLKSVTGEFVKNPDLVKAKATNANSQALAMMNSALGPVSDPTKDWEVQIYPELENGVKILHFQARRVGTPDGLGVYSRWYIHTDDSTFDAVAKAMSTAELPQLRKSYYPDSAKQYLICSVVEQDTVDIPGYGIYQVPELFN